MHRNVWWLGSAQTRWGRGPDPLAGFKGWGPDKGKGGRERERCREERREGEDTPNF